ncbi:MAG: hypothetical protein AB1352_01430 [Patescibacteria group bacterium]
MRVTEQFILNLWPQVASEILLERISEIPEELPVWIIEGDQAVHKLGEIKKALRDLARQEGWYDKHFRVCHAPDTLQDVLREWKVFFPKDQLP